MTEYTIESFNDLTQFNLTNINTNDDNGYTPLCFASLNGVPANVIIDLIDLGANANLVCDRGKSPLQYACLAMNTDAIKALTGQEITYIIEGDEYDDPVEASKAISDKTKSAIVTIDDIFTAAILPKADILNIMTINNEGTKYNFSTTTLGKNNVYHLATLAQCYATLNWLKANDSSKPLTNINAKNNDNKTPIDLAADLKDTGIQKIFVTIENEFVQNFKGKELGTTSSIDNDTKYGLLNSYISTKGIIELNTLYSNSALDTVLIMFIQSKVTAWDDEYKDMLIEGLRPKK